MNKKLNIQILFFEGCPNVEAAKSLVLDALEQTKISAEVSLVEVLDHDDAVSKKFLGSPSFRINGADIEQEVAHQTEYSMRCRLYSSDGSLSGLPLRSKLIEQIEKHA